MTYTLRMLIVKMPGWRRAWSRTTFGLSSIFGAQYWYETFKNDLFAFTFLVTFSFKGAGKAVELFTAKASSCNGNCSIILSKPSSHTAGVDQEGGRGVRGEREGKGNANPSHPLWNRFGTQNLGTNIDLIKPWLQLFNRCLFLDIHCIFGSDIGIWY